MMGVHRLTALASLALAVGLYLAAAGEVSGYEFPRAIAVALIALTAMLVLLAFKPGPSLAEDERPIPWGALWPGLAVIVGYMLLARVLGFFLSSFLTFLVLVLIYAPGRLGWRRVLAGGALGLGFMGILYLIFVVLLNVQMPTGILV